LNTVWLV